MATGRAFCDAIRFGDLLQALHAHASDFQPDAGEGLRHVDAGAPARHVALVRELTRKSITVAELHVAVCAICDHLTVVMPARAPLVIGLAGWRFNQALARANSHGLVG